MEKIKLKKPDTMKKKLMGSDDGLNPMKRVDEEPQPTQNENELVVLRD